MSSKYPSLRARYFEKIPYFQNDFFYVWVYANKSRSELFIWSNFSVERCKKRTGWIVFYTYYQIQLHKVKKELLTFLTYQHFMSCTRANQILHGTWTLQMGEDEMFWLKFNCTIYFSYVKKHLFPMNWIEKILKTFRVCNIWKFIVEDNRGLDWRPMLFSGRTTRRVATCCSLNCTTF